MTFTWDDATRSAVNSSRNSKISDALYLPERPDRIWYRDDIADFEFIAVAVGLIDVDYTKISTHLPSKKRMDGVYMCSVVEICLEHTASLLKRIGTPPIELQLSQFLTELREGLIVYYSRGRFYTGDFRMYFVNQLLTSANAKDVAYNLGVGG